MKFEEALQKMREGYEVAYEGAINDVIFKIEDGQILRKRTDGECYHCFLDEEEIFV